MISITYIVSTLKRCGPNNQLYNIIKYLDRECFVPSIVTLSPEEKDSMIDDYALICPSIQTLNMGRLYGFLSAGKALRTLIENNNPSLIQSQGIRPDYYSAKYLKKFKRIATLRNYPFQDYPFKYGKFRGKFMARLHLKYLSGIDKIFSNSEATSILLKKHRNFNTDFINNGVDTEKYKPDNIKKVDFRKELGISIDARVFISIGHLVKQKDPFTVINGFQKAKLNEKDRLIMLGNGSLLEDCKKYSEDDQRIIITGRKNNVADYIKASDYYISASLTEGLPNAALEACAGGLPMILSDILPHRIILKQNSKYGNLFFLGDASDLADKIDEILIKDRVQIGQHCLNLVKDHFDAKKVSEKYQAVYQSLLNEK